MLIKLEALDPLFFRDGKSFTMGEDAWAETAFPPHPSVFYGALRTAYFANQPSALDRAGTKADPTANLVIHGIFLEREGSLYCPMPLDLVCEKRKGYQEKKVQRLVPRPAPVLSNVRVPMVLAAPEGRKVEAVAEGLMDAETLRDYFALSPYELTYTPLREMITSEPKIGIGRDRITKHAEDSKLYRAEMLRLAANNEHGVPSKHSNVSFVIDYTGIELPASGLMKLGGEGKAVHYEPAKAVAKFVSPKDLTGGFKLYLLTPAVLEHGWLPGWLDEASGIGVFRGLTVKLLTAAVGKYLLVSGFDMAKQRPKPMLKAVPAGSVYYFELLNGDPAKVIDAFQYRPIEDGPYSKEGYGIALLGGIR